MAAFNVPKDVAAVIPSTFLAQVPVDETLAILSCGYRIEMHAGRRASATQDEPVVALVVEGLVRVFLESSAGRQVTVRYARPGDVLGLVHLLGAPSESRLAAISPAQWVIRGSVLLDVMSRSTPLAIAMARECAARTADAMDELSLAFFGSVKARIARHLLDLASSQQEAGELVAAVTHQQIADAVGSVREVVARALAELRAVGAVAGAEGGVTILDAGALDEIATERSRRRA
jgi:CRP/FNR family transcriptional regulator